MTHRRAVGVVLAMAVATSATAVQAQSAKDKAQRSAYVLPLQSTVLDLRSEVVTLSAGQDLLAQERDAQEVSVRLAADVFFEFGKSDLTSAATVALDGIVPQIQSESRGVIRIEGHTDSVDDDTLNQTLSEQRAQAVQSYLAARPELAGRQFDSKGFGETQPIAPNANEDNSDNPAGRAKNRRVTITYDSK